MIARPHLYVVLLSLALVGMGPAPSASRDSRPVPLSLPPEGKLYHGVYPGRFQGSESDIRPADLEAYEQAVGRKVAWVYFSNEWSVDRTFPRATAEWIRARGAVPFIRLMLRSSTDLGRPERIFTLEAIARGTFDRDLRDWGDAARAFRTPILLEFGTEVNGRWFPWNEIHNAPNGPARFRKAYRHLVDVIRSRGATNVSWVFHVNAADDPQTASNRLEGYYPGDDVVSWLAVSAYGVQTPLQSSSAPFVAQMDAAVTRLTRLAPNKPILLAEFGMVSSHPVERVVPWAEAALTSLLQNRWPQVRGFAWWNSAWENDTVPSHNSEMRVQAVPELARVFRTKLASPLVLDTPSFDQ
ncbi:glycoside hydrolase family 26 protein [Deinococcus peraridilitoris]|uniref:Beta-mannanase n=1 Tax=Deinococcus peraridilitoris (strain DSM 19664 / LMG 22246 / CIP 109416 / KR-200) TaxID=937777 RepID=L0A7D0_DEIPD|nr:glycosyl hydrolase [Deinococcus peraridilitoris]AFZ68965.1 beta-mannanase [Deinococcus peraridilitoris DSM 19664]